MLYCFLDTNIFMQFEMFDQVNWTDVLDTAEVCLVVPYKVIEELDKHKTDPTSDRRRNRARKILPKIEQFFGKQSDADLGNNTFLRIQTTSPDAQWLRDHRRDPENADDCIIGAAHLFAEDHPADEVVLFTDDTGPRLKAGSVGIRAIRPPGNLRLKDETDPVQKELQHLKRENERLKNLRPKLEIGFRQSDGELTREIEFAVDFTPNTLAESEIETAIAAKRDELVYTGPVRREEEELSWGEYKSQFAESLQKFSSSVSDSLGLISPSQTEVNTYAEKIGEYLAGEYRWFLERSIEFDTRQVRTRSIAIALENRGTVPAEDIDVWLHFHDGLELERDPIPRPKEPPPPIKPRRRSRYENLSELLRPAPTDYSRLLMPHLRDTRSIHPAPPPLTIRKVDSYKVEWCTDSLKHHFVWKWPLLYATFEVPNSLPKIIPVDYEIRAANVPDLAKGALLIRLVEA